MSLFQNGILVDSSKQYVIEAVSSDQHLHHEQHDHHRRVKRENLHETDAGSVHLVLIYETSGGKCGLQSQNRKQLYAPDLHEKTIKLQQDSSSSTSSSSAEQFEHSRNTIEFQKKLLLNNNDNQNRQKRQTGNNNANDFYEKAIEIAVFVDDDLYYKTKKSSAGDPIEEIQNLVFAYLNSVMLVCFYTSKLFFFFYCSMRYVIHIKNTGSIALPIVPA